MLFTSIFFFSHKIFYEFKGFLFSGELYFVFYKNFNLGLIQNFCKMLRKLFVLVTKKINFTFYQMKNFLDSSKAQVPEMLCDINALERERERERERRGCTTPGISGTCGPKYQHQMENSHCYRAPFLSKIHYAST